MNVNKALSVFIMDDVLPLEKDSFSRFALGGLAAASGLEIFKIKGLDSFDVNQNPEQLHEVIKGAFAAQGVITLTLADFMDEAVFEKYPVLKIPCIQKALRKPYDIDQETVEKFFALLAQE